MRIMWDPEKSEWLKKHPKRSTSFEEAKVILEDPSKEIGGELKSDELEQYYTVGIAGNGAMVTLVYEFRHDLEGPYIWLVTLWKTTREEKRNLEHVQKAYR